jgi:predicted AAA+ superfamily ATPase
MIALSGLRGVGKTTLMWQTADYIYKNHTKKIFFISVDDLNRLNATLYDVINVLEKDIFHCSLNELDSRVMIMIDEVHEAKEWQKDIKILYERGKKLFVLTTGSSALLLHSSSDLASRWTFMKIFPFKFPEFILGKSWLNNPANIQFPIKGLSGKLKKIFFYSSDYREIRDAINLLKEEIIDYLTGSEKIIGESINSLIDEYISYHNIARFLPLANKTLIIERVLSLFERILLKDIPQINTDFFEIYNRILFRLALSDEINFHSLSKDFKIKETDIEKIITTLNNAEILNVFLPHGGIRTRTGGNKKAFFMSPSLRRSLYARIYGDKLKEDLRAKLYEDIFAMYLKKNLSEGMVSYGFGKKKNPDFIIETMDSPVLMEIGINKTNTMQIKSYPNYRYGIIINSKINQMKFDNSNRIIFIPLSWALLL